MGMHNCLVQYDKHLSHSYRTRLDNGLRGLNCWAQTDCVELEDTSIRGLIERKCTQQNGMVDLTCGQSIFSGQTSLGHYLSQAGNGYNVSIV